jgi:hypothetical protein
MYKPRHAAQNAVLRVLLSLSERPLVGGGGWTKPGKIEGAASLDMARSFGRKKVLGGANRTADCADHYGDRLRLANGIKFCHAIKSFEML